LVPGTKYNMFYWAKMYTEQLKQGQLYNELGEALERWLIFLDDSPEEVLKMAMEKDNVIAKAEETLKKLGSINEIRAEYEYREKAIMKDPICK